MTVKVNRLLNSVVANKLRSGDPFLYAHLVKFEKPIKTVTGDVAESAHDYSYLTDASHNITFDDGSKNSTGGWNGSQTYVAQRLNKVGQVSETTQAKATSMALSIDSIALNTNVASSSTTVVHSSTPQTVTISESWIDSGFTEGDKVRMESNDGNNGKYFIIKGFKNNNKTATVSLEAEGVSTPTNNPNTTYIFTVETEEHSSVFASKSEDSYAHYINREVYVYKALLDPSTGAVLGLTSPPVINSVQQGYDETYVAGPILIFKGIIASVKLKEDPSKSSTVIWNLTSHWGDFVSINGRLTSDTEHRGINGEGKTDYAALIRPEYINDFGFQHSEQALNLIAKYQATETKYKFKKSGFLGMGSGRTIEYEEKVDREIELKFNLDARRLPVVYGVNRIDSFPIFVDLDRNATSNVYAAYALCEGEIGGLYDIYLDDQSRICADLNDSTSRSATNEAASVVCEGRKDRGDTLKSDALRKSTGGYVYGGPYGSITINGVDYKGGPREQWVWSPEDGFQLISDAANNTKNQATGIRHELGHNFQSPISGKLVFHRGKPDQDADETLVNKAASIQQNSDGSTTGGFLVQSQYFEAENKSNYWGPNHRLLDTAYAVCHFEISEEELQIPELEFVVRGRILPCFNYDWAYRPDSYPPSGSNINVVGDWQLGQSVNLKKLNGSVIKSGVTIADFYTYYDEDSDGSTDGGDPPVSTDKGAHQIWRFASDPELGDVTQFYMENTAGNKKWYFTTHDHKYVDSAAITTDLVATVASYADGSSSTGTKITLASGSELMGKIFEYVKAIAPVFNTSAPDEARAKINYSWFSTYDEANDTTKVDTTSYLVLDKISNIVPANGWNTTDIPKVRVPKAIAIPGGNTTEDYYFGMIAKLTRTKADGTKVVQTRLIVRSKNITHAQTSVVIAVVSHDWDIDASGDFTLSPTTAAGLGGGSRVADKLEIVSKPDNRISINPAMQLLDYITNKRYGKGLDLEKDINLDSFKTVARLCDTRSDVSIIFAATTSVTVGDIYNFKDGFASGARTSNDTGNIVWQGTVSTISSNVTFNGDSYKEVTFTDCIGKLGNKWFDWKPFYTGDIIWEPVTGRLWRNQETGTNNQQPDKISVPSSTGAFHQANELKLFKVSGSGDANISPYIGTFTGGQGTNAIDGSVTFEGNPLIKSWSGTGFTVNGYSLYDADDVKYWRYLGWQNQNQREVTRHQACPVLDTNTTVFQNINSLLAHFNGILRYSNGKYELDLQTAAVLNGFGENDVRIIKEDDIVGAISVEDNGQKASKNTVSVSFPDPQQEYGNRSVTYFNSTYLAEDRNVPKKHDVKTPHILNYYNARINAKQYLDQSRYGKKINFLMEPKGALLLAGTIVQMSYPRFGWGSIDIPVAQFSANGTVGETTTVIPHGFKVGDIVRYEGISMPVNHGSIAAAAFNDSYFTISEVPDKTTFRTDQTAVTTVTPSNTITLGKVFKKGDYYRISNLNLREDCSVQVTAIEHNDESFLIKKRKSDIGGSSGEGGGGVSAVGAVTNVAAVGDDTTGRITVTWTNNSESINDGKFKGNYEIEVLNNTVSSTDGGPGASRINENSYSGSLTGSDAFDAKFIYEPEGEGTVTRYHWVRLFKNEKKNDIITSYGSPLAPTGAGVAASVNVAQIPRSVDILATNGVVVFYEGETKTNPPGSLTFRATPKGFSAQKKWFFRYYTNRTGSTNFIKSATAGTSNATTSDHYKGVTTWNGSANAAYHDFTLDPSFDPKSYASNHANGTFVHLYVEVFELETSATAITANDTASAEQHIILSAVDIGQPEYNVDYNNATHVFYAQEGGTASATEYGGNTPVVYRKDGDGRTLLTYKPYNSSLSGSDLNSWSYNASDGNETTNQTSNFSTDGITGTNCAPVLDTTNGKITLGTDNAGIISGTTVPDTASILLQIKDNKRIKGGFTGVDSDIQFKTLNFIKLPKLIRDGTTYIVDVADLPEPGQGVTYNPAIHDYIDNATHTAWIDPTNLWDTANENSTDQYAQEAALVVIAKSEDGFVRPNDILTITKSGAESASRIYKGTATNSASSVAHGDWSSKVVKNFKGSVIVDGTLSAEALTANTTLTNNLKVGSSMIIGSVNDAGVTTAGRIHTPNKTMPGTLVPTGVRDTDDGIFIGVVQKDGATGTNDPWYPIVDIGDGTNYLRYNSQEGFQLGGSMAVAATGASGQSTALMYKRSTSALTASHKPPNTYTSLDDVEDHSSGWTIAIPTGSSNTLWAIAGYRASYTSATQSNTFWTWDDPFQLEGVDGQGVYTASIYQGNSSSTAPTLPTGSATYANPLAGTANGWTLSIPQNALQNNGDYIWTSTRKFYSDNVGNDANWSNAVIYSYRKDGVDSTAVGQTGAPGAGIWNYTTSGTPSPTLLTGSVMLALTGRAWAVLGDVVIITGSSIAAYKCNTNTYNNATAYNNLSGSSNPTIQSIWPAAGMFIDNSLIVDGGITGSKLDIVAPSGTSGIFLTQGGTNNTQSKIEIKETSGGTTKTRVTLGYLG